MVTVVWRRSHYDNRVHAFPLAQVAEPRCPGGCLEALCSHHIPPDAVGGSVYVANGGLDGCTACQQLIVGGVEQLGVEVGASPP